jgi:hypothetical protein
MLSRISSPSQWQVPQTTSMRRSQPIMQAFGKPLIMKFTRQSWHPFCCICFYWRNGLSSIGCSTSGCVPGMDRLIENATQFRLTLELAPLWMPNCCRKWLLLMHSTSVRLAFIQPEYHGCCWTCYCSQHIGWCSGTDCWGVDLQVRRSY